MSADRRFAKVQPNPTNHEVVAGEGGIGHEKHDCGGQVCRLKVSERELYQSNTIVLTPNS